MPPCLSMDPKWFWSSTRQSFWTGHIHFVQVQIIKISPEKSNLNLTKMIWTRPTQFGPIEGQDISILTSDLFSRNSKRRNNWTKMEMKHLPVKYLNLPQRQTKNWNSLEDRCSYCVYESVTNQLRHQKVCCQFLVTGKTMGFAADN